MKTLGPVRKYPWLPAVSMTGALIALVMSGFGMPRPGTIHEGRPAGFDSVMHWHDASHDWLLVADGQANQVSVYDALDGRPLHRLNMKNGVNDMSALAQRDGRLFVVGDDGKLGELKLPQLQLVASSKP